MFSLITIIFIVCVLYTITSFDEIPLDILEDEAHIHDIILTSNAKEENKILNCDTEKTYGAMNENIDSSDVHNVFNILFY